MRLCFLILAHKSPAQTIRLISRLQSPNSRFFVHIDKRAPESVYAPISNWAAQRDDVVLTPRHRCYWGQFSLVEASLTCIACALERCDFDYGFLLSGQDYPIKPVHTIFDFMAANCGQQFIESFRLDRENRWSNNEREFQSMNRISWYTTHFRSRRFSIPMHRQMPLGLTPCGGEQWWALSREALIYISAFLQVHPHVLKFFRHSFAPDESIFQTILFNSPFAKNMTHERLHYVDHERPNPAYPRTLDHSDLDRLETSDKLFARKFNNDYFLDLVDQTLLLR